MKESAIKFTKKNRLGTLVSQVVTPTCQQQGFIQASILLDWEEIIGAQFSQLCQPEKITFPLHHRRFGRLYLRASSGIAPEIAHLEPQIVEKINRYFGYQAVSRLTIRQGPINRSKPLEHLIKKSVTEEQQNQLRQQIFRIEDESLKEALYNLGCGIISDDSSY